MYSTPLRHRQLLDLAQENGGNVLTLEDNYGGSIGSAVADALTEDGGGFTQTQLCVPSHPQVHPHG
jgi:transketolase